jgi:hypothetical protein
MKKQNEGGELLRTATRCKSASHPTLGARVSERRNALAYKRQFRREGKKGLRRQIQHGPFLRLPRPDFQLFSDLNNRQKTLTHHKNQPITISLDGNGMI